MFRIIDESGLNPRDFIWQQVKSKYILHDPTVSFLLHKPTSHFFLFDFTTDTMDRERRVSVYSPGESQRTETMESRSWEDQLIFVVNWAQNLKREIDEPDLWESLAQGAGSSQVRLPSGTADSRFTPAEQKEIRRALDDLADRIIAEVRGLSAEQRKLVKEGFAQIAEAAKELKRSHWYGFAIGTFVSLMLDAGIRGAIVGTLFSMARAVFQSLATGTPTLPGP